MARRKNWSAEQIVSTLRQIEVQVAQGMSLALALEPSHPIAVDVEEPISARLDHQQQ